MGFPDGSTSKESTCLLRRHEFNPCVRKILWSRKWQPTPVFLPGKFLGQRSLEGYSPWGGKESDTVSTHAVSRTHSVVLLYVLSLTSKLFAGSEAANFGVLFPSCVLGSSQAVSFIISYTCSLLTSHFAMNWFKLTSLTPNRW